MQLQSQRCGGDRSVPQGKPIMIMPACPTIHLFCHWLHALMPTNPITRDKHMHSGHTN